MTSFDFLVAVAGPFYFESVYMTYKIWFKDLPFIQHNLCHSTCFFRVFTIIETNFIIPFNWLVKEWFQNISSHACIVTDGPPAFLLKWEHIFIYVEFEYQAVIWHIRYFCTIMYVMIHCRTTDWISHCF